LFEGAEPTPDYRVDVEALKRMLEDKVFAGITWEKEGNEELPQYIFDVLDVKKTGFINFADYMFIRKTNLAWKKCSKDDRISRKLMICAISVAVPGRRMYLPDATELFDIATTIYVGSPVQDTSTITFRAFFEISRIYYFFQEFNIPFDDGYLQKKDMLRAINEQNVPQEITPFVVNVFFEAIANPDQPNERNMNFQSFAALFNIFRKFVRHAETNEAGLTKEEFYDMLEESVGD